jgi:hypothetical protein
LEITLKLNEQQVNGLAQLLMIAAKHPDVTDDGMKLALSVIDEIKAAVAEAKQKDDA